MRDGVAYQRRLRNGWLAKSVAAAVIIAIGGAAARNM
jgi:hypothetical protein